MGTVDGRGRLSTLTIEQWFGVALLAVLGVLVIDLVRRLVFGELRFGTFSTFLWRGLVDGLIGRGAPGGDGSVGRGAAQTALPDPAVAAFVPGPVFLL